MASDKNFSGPEKSKAFIAELSYATCWYGFPQLFALSFIHKTILHIIKKFVREIFMPALGT
jgi:hypothetical protein